MRKLHDPWSWCCRFKGVFKGKGGKYQAHISIHKQSEYLGTYLDAEEAAKAFDAAKIFLVCTLNM